jgi:hypothetical protein
MLKTSTLVLFLTIVSICANAQEKWFSQKVSDKVTVNFPGEPKKLSDVSYGYNAKDSTVFVVSIVDLLKATGMDLATFNSNVETQEFADGFMEGLTPTMARFSFRTAKIIKIKNLPAYEIVGRADDLKKTIYMNVVFVDGVAHTLACLIGDGKDTKNKDKFIAGEIYIK